MLDIDRFTTTSDILEGFGTAPHLMSAYSRERRRDSVTAETRYYKTVPNIVRHTTPITPIINMDTFRASYE